MRRAFEDIRFVLHCFLYMYIRYRSESIMVEYNLTYQMKRSALIVAFSVEQGGLEIATFLKVREVRNELEPSRENVVSVSQRKIHAQPSDPIRTSECVPEGWD